MNTTRRTLLFVSLFIPEFLWAQAGSWEVPFDARTQEGNSGTLYPFSYGFTRYQQVNGATNFGTSLGGTTVGPGGVLLQTMFIRLDSPNGFDSVGYTTNLQINLSTTTRQPDSLSPVFANNIGANDQTVFGPTTLAMSGDHLPFTPQPWESGAIIHFSQPFLYRPTDGNLLLDIRFSGGSSFPEWMDAWNRTNDSVSGVYGAIGDASGTTTTLGFSTLFYGTLVPEPSTYALFAIGAATLLLFRKRKP